MRLRTVLTGTAVVVVGVVVAAVAIVANMDFSQYKGLIAQKTKEATGRDLDIKGELKLVLGLSPSLAVSDVSFANASWGTRPQMVQVQRLETQVDLLPLLSGDIRVKRLVLIRPDILLEADARGRGNWEFEAVGGPAQPAPQPQPSTPGGGAMNLPQVNEVEIRDAKLVHRDGKSGEAMTLQLARALLRADGETAPLKLDIDGAFNALRFQLAGQVGSVAALGAPCTAFPVNVTARVADAATVTAEAVVRLSRRRDGQGVLVRIRRVLLVEGDRAGAGLYRNGTLQIVVAPYEGLAGRPSSDRILVAAGAR